MTEFKMGQKAEFSKTISESNVYLFSGISCDFNPIHLNIEYGKNSFLKVE